jgi:hypothetical protein
MHKPFKKLHDLPEFGQ